MVLKPALEPGPVLMAIRWSLQRGKRHLRSAVVDAPRDAHLSQARAQRLNQRPLRIGEIGRITFAISHAATLTSPITSVTQARRVTFPTRSKTLGVAAS